MEFEKLIKLLQQSEQSTAHHAFSEVNRLIEGLTRQRSIIAGISYVGITRFLHYAAMAISAEDVKVNGKKTNYYAVDYTKLTNEFVGLENQLSPHCNVYVNTNKCPEPMIKKFASGAESQGVKKPFFYSSILLFILYMGTSQDFKTAHSERWNYLKANLPKEDLALPAKIYRLIESKLTSGQTIPESSVTSYPARVHFDIDLLNHQKFERFYDSVSYRGFEISELEEKFRPKSHYPDDHVGAQFIIYRAKNSDPNTLIKSYLWISATPPEKRHNDIPAFQFSHFYELKNEAHSRKFSSGKVLPLEHGVFFLGGQRFENMERRPFASIKAISVDWAPINNRDKVIPILIMGTNAKGKHIVTRGAMRATPFNHSKKNDLDEVALHDLKGNLLKDLEAECKLLARNEKEKVGNLATKNKHAFLSSDREKLQKCAEDFGNEILKMTNNAPSADESWIVPEGYYKSGGRNPEALDKSKFLQMNKMEFYRGTERFTLFGSLRFGPINNQ